MTEPLWKPSPDAVAATAMDRFRRDRWPEAANTGELWQLSVDRPGAFWRSVWEWCGVIGDPGAVDLSPALEGQARAHPDQFRSTTFLPEATLNVAENLLASRPGADETAIIAMAEGDDPDGGPITEDWTWERLRAETAAVARALRRAGVVAGDRVAAWMPHRPETVVAFLASASMGAVFTSTSADFGSDGVVDRFGQTEPVVLVAATGYRYGGRWFDLTDRLSDIVRRLPSVETVIVVGESRTGTACEPFELDGKHVLDWSETVDTHAGAELVFDPLPTNHPLYILYSSGTTGRPKCIVHRSGGVLLKHLSEQRLHSDIRAGDRVFYFTTCGWMMWNWLVSALGCGATIVLYDGNPAHPGPSVLFEAAEKHSFTLFGTSAKFIDAVMKSGYEPSASVDLSSVRTVCSTGSPLSPEGFRWVYESMIGEVHLASISGGTDLCGCLVLGDPTGPVHAGEIQMPALGLRTTVYTPDGQPAGIGERGELVCENPFPSMPLTFWGDDGHQRYHDAYFARFESVARANGFDVEAVWAHGDFAVLTPNGGMEIVGRSDATLNAGGVRIGTAEIYRIVEQLDEVVEAIAVAQEFDGDTRIVLFVRLADGVVLDAELERRLRTELQTKGSPRHVPAVIATVDDIPRTRSGKITELAVTDVIHGRNVVNVEALANPESLDEYRDRPELA